MIGGYSVITQDVLPFSTTVSTREMKIFGANETGLERREFSDRLDRGTAESVPAADPVGPEYVAGGGAHSCGSGADPGGRRNSSNSWPPRNAGS